jgi:DMSO/TMAO reductase YedYZ heme-binding membrane subunit
MVKLLIRLLTFLSENFSLLTSVAVLAVLFLLLARSIKKHPAVYYLIFSIPALIYVFRQICSPLGIGIFDFSRGSAMGELIREYVHVSGFAYPLLLIIMYIGALPAGNPYVKRLMMIRKEISIISGFPILVHAWVRLRMAFGACDFFFGSGGKMAAGGAGAVFVNSAYLLGILMAVLFIVLWITSFDAVHKRLGGSRWKKVQRWSYVLYGMLFVHSVCLSAGRLLGGGGHGGGGERTRAVAEAAGNMARGGGGRGLAGAVQGAQGAGHEIAQAAAGAAAHGGHGAGGSDPHLAAIIGLATTCLIFASYLFLRIRKARKK